MDYFRPRSTDGIVSVCLRLCGGIEMTSNRAYGEIWRGWLVVSSWGEGEALWLATEPGHEKGTYDYDWNFIQGDDPLAEQIKNLMEEHGDFLSVNYYVAPERFTPEEVTGFVARLMVGEGYANVGHAYSEVTGYLWTDEEIKVGGHDLIAELTTHKGKFVQLEIGFSKEGIHA